jgi:predicted polyphosphate/ATP-dependent NAD kinase
MFSGIFSVNPQAASLLLEQFLDDQAEIRDGEVMDINEERYRENALDISLFGYAQTIYLPHLVQRRKSTFQKEDEKESKQAISFFMRELMGDGALYILGAGTTTKAITDLMGLEKTLLGVDLVKNEKIVARDVSERDLLMHIAQEDQVRIVVSPIGAQGFLLGRGTQQMSPTVIKRVGVENIIPVATPYKLSRSSSLFVDTGDAWLDRVLAGERLVICGYRMAQRKRVMSGSIASQLAVS